MFSSKLKISGVYVLFLLLCSCAQVGFLTGGEKDVVAPEPAVTFPENGCTSFTGQKVQLVFGEFIQLKDPQQIVLIPNDARIDAVVRKKTLTLQWKDTLQQQTTYVIYFNNAVSDVTEGNTGFFTYVFSTGTALDTLTRNVKVKYATNGSSAAKIMVGLFSGKDSLKPFYFSSTDQQGVATFRYLKAGKYAVRAFSDENKDLKISPMEDCGFLSDSVHISPSETDTLDVLLFKPLPKKWIPRFEFKAPGVYEVELVQPLPEPHFTINGNPVEKTNVRKVNETIYRFIPKDSVQQNTLLVLNAGSIIDSSALRIIPSERIAPLLLSLYNGHQVVVGNPLVFVLNQEIKTVDTSRIHLTSVKDSLTRLPFKMTYQMDQLFIQPLTSTGGAYRIVFSTGAINDATKKESFNLELKTKKELGTLHLLPEGFKTPIIVELCKEKTTVAQRRFASGSDLTFEDLMPGEYTIKVIEDKNENGLYDTGDLYKKLQPEKVKVYHTPLRIRPNWDTKIQVKAED